MIANGADLGTCFAMMASLGALQRSGHQDDNQDKYADGSLKRAASRGPAGSVREQMEQADGQQHGSYQQADGQGVAPE